MISTQQQFDTWLAYLVANPELPESLEEWNWDLTDQDQSNNRSIGISEFWDQVMNDLGVPEDDRDELMEAFEKATS